MSWQKLKPRWSKESDEALLGSLEQYPVKLIPALARQLECPSRRAYRRLRARGISLRAIKRSRMLQIVAAKPPGESIRSYCRAIGIKPSRFCWWQRQAEQEAEAAIDRQAKADSSETSWLSDSH